VTGLVRGNLAHRAESKVSDRQSDRPKTTQANRLEARAMN
jgi:hypothetical protein